MLNLPPESKPIDPKDILIGDTVCIHKSNTVNGCHSHFTGVVSEVEDKGRYHNIYFGNSTNTHYYSIYKSGVEHSAYWVTTVHLLSRPPRWAPITLQDLRTLPLGSRVRLSAAEKYEAEGTLTSRLEALNTGLSYDIRNGDARSWYLFEKELAPNGHQVLLPS